MHSRTLFFLCKLTDLSYCISLAATDKVSYETTIDQFTVVGLVTWPLNGSEAGVDLVLIKTSHFYYANQVALMLTSLH